MLLGEAKILHFSVRYANSSNSSLHNLMALHRSICKFVACNNMHPCSWSSQTTIYTPGFTTTSLVSRFIPDEKFCLPCFHGHAVLLFFPVPLFVFEFPFPLCPPLPKPIRTQILHQLLRQRAHKRFGAEMQATEVLSS